MIRQGECTADLLLGRIHRLVLLIDIRRALTFVDKEQWPIIATLAQIALLFHPVVAVVSALL